MYSKMCGFCADTDFACLLNCLPGWASYPAGRSVRVQQQMQHNLTDLVAYRQGLAWSRPHTGRLCSFCSLYKLSTTILFCHNKALYA